MIATLQPWKSKAELEALCNQSPGSIDIIGEVYEEGLASRQTFSGLLTLLRYKQTLLTTHKGESYVFTMGTDGRYHVS